jgi:pimeloyl-ACP methyl ester carboxylesterase
VAAACGTPRYAVWGYSFGGNVARYLGSWTDQVTACAIIGVGFGPAVDEDFDRYVDTFVQQWEPLAREYREGRKVGPAKRVKVKDQIPSLVACLQAMRQWPAIEPGEMRCPTMLLLGTRNKAAMGWVQDNGEALQQAQVQVEIVEGLDHPQEFSQVERVFPAVQAFFS